MSTRHPNVVNIDEIEPLSRGAGTKFGSSARRLGTPTGAKALGCTHYTVEPGRSAMPAHFHCQNEEALFVLEGEGTVRIGEARVAVRPGDWVALPIGPEHAHRLENTGTVPLRYLCVSTMSTGEVVGYPDSKKIGAVGGTSMGPGSKPWVAVWVPEGAGVNYFEGEDVG